MENDMDIEAQNLCEAEVGDWVELELQDNAFMHAILIMYGIPLVGLVLGLVLGYFVVAPLVPIINEGLTSFIAVSYTHLDVYKRQNLQRLWITKQRFW